jgi:GTPase SAR1 family protein
MAMLVFYDVTDKDSWGHVKNWLQECERYGREEAVQVVVGTKIDLLHNGQERAVPIEEVLEFCEGLSLEYCECSSKTGRGVSAAYARITALLLEQTIPDMNVGLTIFKAPKKRSKEKCAVM